MQEHLLPFLRNNRILMLAYDQGFEHGPADFDEKNYHPDYILDIAKNGNFSCVAMHCGIASKFWKNRYEGIPLVMKLNGKSNLGKKAYSVANATVEEAERLGAKAIGYTIYLGGEYEAEMIREFSKLRKEAHDRGMGVFAWMYPFITLPSSNDDELEWPIVAYAARVGAELGADVIKIKYPHQPEKLDWIIKNAVGTRAVLSGGDKVSDDEFIAIVRNFLSAGGSGVAVGRNVWQNSDPLNLSTKLAEVVYNTPSI